MTPTKQSQISIKYQKCYPKGYQIGNDIIGEIGYFQNLKYAKKFVLAFNNHDKIVEALKECINSLDVYVNGNNPNSLYKEGQHHCYVMGSKEALNKAQQALK